MSHEVAEHMGVILVVALLLLARLATPQLVRRRCNLVHVCEHLQGPEHIVRGVSWSEVATVPKRKLHRGLDLDLSLNSEVNIRKGWKESGGTK